MQTPGPVGLETAPVAGSKPSHWINPEKLSVTILATLAGVALLTGAYGIGKSNGRAEGFEKSQARITSLEKDRAAIAGYAVTDLSAPIVQQQLSASSTLNAVSVAEPDFFKNGTRLTVGAGIDQDGKPTFLAKFTISNRPVVDEANLTMSQEPRMGEGQSFWFREYHTPITAEMAKILIGEKGIKEIRDQINKGSSSPLFIQPKQFQELLDKNGIKISAAPGVDLRHVLAMGIRQRGERA